jgi:uncharacterized protein (TIRG00374 family)
MRYEPDGGPRASAASRLALAGKVLVSVLACALLVGFVDWRRFAELALAARPAWLAAALAVAFANRAFMAWKWIVLLRGVGDRTPAGELWGAYYVGAFCGKFLPTSVGGDLLRVAWLARRTGNTAIVLSSVLIERLLGAVALALFAAVGLALLAAVAGRTELRLAGVTLGLLAAAALGAGVLFHGRSLGLVLAALERLVPVRALRRGLGRLGDALTHFRGRPRALRRFLWLSLAEQLFPILFLALAARAFAIDLPLVWILIGLPVILAVSRVPVSVQNLGVQEGIFVFVLSLAGVPASSAVLLSMAQRLAGVLSTAPGALLLPRGVWRGRTALEAPAREAPLR